MKSDEKSNVCEVCKDEFHKYKCPCCRVRYCSLSCFKIHKDSTCVEETKREEDKEKECYTRLKTAVQTSKLEIEFEEGEVLESESDDEDRVSPQTLEKLGHSRELRNMLFNKHLKEMIKEIDASQNPEKLLTNAMQIPIFTEFVDACLRIVEPQEDQEMECI